MDEYKEKRTHPRAELLAQVQVAQDSEVYIMSTRNISRGGLFIVGDPSEYPELISDMEVTLVIFAADDLSLKDVHAKAKIIRVEKGHGLLNSGFGLQFTTIEKDQIENLDQILQMTM